MLDGCVRLQEGLAPLASQAWSFGVFGHAYARICMLSTVLSYLVFLPPPLEDFGRRRKEGEKRGLQHEKPSESDVPGTNSGLLIQVYRKNLFEKERYIVFTLYNAEKEIQILVSHQRFVIRAHSKGSELGVWYVGLVLRQRRAAVAVEVAQARSHR